MANYDPSLSQISTGAEADMKIPTRSPAIDSVENFWFKHELGIKLVGWLLVLGSVATGIISR